MNESQAIQNAAQDVRARERFPYQDCIQIGPGASKVEGWLEDFQELANQDSLYLFNVRSRATAGGQYCNVDSPSLFDVGYLMESISVQFEAPVVNTWFDNGGLAPATYTMAMFQQLIDDSSLQFFLNQDEKIAGAVPLFPAGYGPTGRNFSIQNGYADAGNYATIGTFTNGIADFKNQWTFADPIEIPRNHTVYAILKFSELARFNLANIAGPGYMRVSSNSGISAPGYVPAFVNLRVTVNGTRLVQLRNAQTYR